MTADSDEPDVPIVCPKCETSSRVPLATVGDAIDRHNARFHDGADVAAVDPAVTEHIADMVAEDMGLLEDG